MPLRTAKCWHTGGALRDYCCRCDGGTLLPERPGRVEGQAHQPAALARGQTVQEACGLSPGEPPADRNCMNEPDKTGPNYSHEQTCAAVTRFGGPVLWQQVTNTQTVRGAGRPYILPRVRGNLWLSPVEDCNPEGSSCTPRPCICSFCQAWHFEGPEGKHCLGRHHRMVPTRNS